MEDDTIDMLKQVAIANYEPSAVESLLEKHSLEELMNKLLQCDLTSDRVFHAKTAIHRILEKKEYFSKAIENPETRKAIEGFITSEEEDQREFFASILASHDQTTIELLTRHSQEPDHPAITNLMLAVFTLLKDSESQVGLKMAKFVSKVASGIGNNSELDYFLCSENSVKTLESFLSCGNAVVEIRTFEMLVLTCNNNERLYAELEKRGLITKGLDLYSKYKDDILEKMNIVDVLGTLGTTATGCNILCSHKAFKEIKKEALAKDTDTFVAKSLNILLIELVNHEKIPYSFQLFKEIRIRMEEIMMGGYGEELNACFEMIKAFGKSVEGFNVVFSTKSVLLKLCLSCNSNKEGEQKKALEAILGLLHPRKVYLDPSKKGQTATLENMNQNGRCIEFIAIYISNPLLLKSIIELSDGSYQKEAMNFFINQMMQPFVEVELLFLRILIELINVEPILNAFCKCSQSLDYLHMKLAKSKQVFDAKLEFKNLLVHRLMHLKETIKDSFYDMYLQEYKIKEEQRKQEVMQYATDTG